MAMFKSSVFKLFLQVLSKKVWYDLINLQAVYLQPVAFIALIKWQAFRPLTLLKRE